MRRDRRRHADRDARRAVDEEVREARRQDDGLEVDAVEVRPPVDGLLADLGEELDRERLEARLGVAVGRGRVAVERAEVAVPVHERRAEREGLRHADHRVVDRDVAVRVVLADDVADDRRGLLELRVRHQVEVLVHREEDPALDRLEAVAHVGQRARRDDRERVVQVPAPGLLGKRDLGIERQRRLAAARWRAFSSTWKDGTGPVRVRQSALGKDFVSPGRLTHSGRAVTLRAVHREHAGRPRAFRADRRRATARRSVAFYDRHAPVLFGFCVRILKDARDAEDVLQETFVQAWRDARRFDAGPRVGEDVAVHDRAEPRARPVAEPPVGREARFPAAGNELARPRRPRATGGADAAAMRDYVGRCLAKAFRERAGRSPPRVLRRLHAGRDRRAPERASRHGEEPHALRPDQAPRDRRRGRRGGAVADDRFDPARGARHAAELAYWAECLEAELDATETDVPAELVAAPPPEVRDRVLWERPRAGPPRRMTGPRAGAGRGRAAGPRPRDDGLGARRRGFLHARGGVRGALVRDARRPRRHARRTSRSSRRCSTRRPATSRRRTRSSPG